MHLRAESVGEGRAQVGVTVCRTNGEQLAAAPENEHYY